jgi:hypothetical protein
MFRTSGGNNSDAIFSLSKILQRRNVELCLCGRSSGAVFSLSKKFFIFSPAFLERKCGIDVVWSGFLVAGLIRNFWLLSVWDVLCCDLWIN